MELISPLRLEKVKKIYLKKLYSQDLKSEQKTGIIMLSKQEYAEVCSSIRTRYADRIPKSRGILYGNHYYVFHYEKKNEKLVFVRKLPIGGNEEIIRRMEEKYGK